MKEITIRAKAFSHYGVETVRVSVDGNTFKVYDSVAGHFTTCHSLSESAKRRVKKALL